MLTDLNISRVRRSRLAEVDFDNLGFGTVFCDHMFSMIYEDGEWGGPEVVPYGPMAIEPGNSTFHCGQVVFEGLKAFHGTDGQARIFRPDMNASRLQRSCERMCVPPIDTDLFLDAVDLLVRIDHAWIPRKRGEAFYLRPMIFSIESHLEVRASTRFRFLIITSPVRAYFKQGMNGVSLKVEETYTRAFPGGTGNIKTPGNYGASLYPTRRASEQGFPQVLWLDGRDHRFIEEVGAMNIFFRREDRLLTPDLHGSILPGITRQSTIELLRAAGHRVEERRISIDEIIDGIRNGSTREAFAAGTAAIIAPVGKLGYRDEVHVINDNRPGEVTRWLYDRLTGIQLGEIEDTYGWNRVVTLDEPALEAVARHSRRGGL